MSKKMRGVNQEYTFQEGKNLFGFDEDEELVKFLSFYNFPVDLETEKVLISASFYVVPVKVHICTHLYMCALSCSYVVITYIYI